MSSSSVSFVSRNISTPEQVRRVPWNGKEITPISSVLMGAVVGGAMGSLLGPFGTLIGAVVGVAIGIIAGYAGYALAKNLHSQPSIPISTKVDDKGKEEDQEQIESSPLLSESHLQVGPDPVVVQAKIWKAAQIVGDLKIHLNGKEELSDDEKKLILEAYAYCKVPAFKDLVPQSIAKPVLKEGRKLTNPHPDDQNVKDLELAEQEIEEHPRFRNCSEEVKETLAFRLYNYFKATGDIECPDFIAHKLDLTPVQR